MRTSLEITGRLSDAMDYLELGFCMEEKIRQCGLTPEGWQCADLPERIRQAVLLEDIVLECIGLKAFAGAGEYGMGGTCCDLQTDGGILAEDGLQAALGKILRAAFRMLQISFCAGKNEAEYFVRHRERWRAMILQGKDDLLEEEAGEKADAVAWQVMKWYAGHSASGDDEQTTVDEIQNGEVMA